MTAVAPRLRVRLLALGLGTVCHASFAAGVAAMAMGLWSGLTTGRGALHGTAATVANTALLVQFPLLHSGLLTRRGRAWLARLAPAPYGRDLTSTTYATIASLQVLAVFALWTPSGVVWWRPESTAVLVACAAAFACAWLFLLRALHDGHLALQTGLLGWWAVWRGRRPDYGPLPERGTFALCRQPIYLGFALTLWTGPVWTPDRLALAVAWTTYCALGPLHKERRFAAIHGARFEAYRRRTPYLVPRPVRRPATGPRPPELRTPDIR